MVLYNLVVSDAALRIIDPSGTIERCTIKELHVTFPWQALFTESTKVRIVCVEIVIRVDVEVDGPEAAAQSHARSGAAESRGAESDASQRDAVLRDPSPERTAEAAAAPPPPEWIMEWIKPIVEHIAIDIDNVVVKLHVATAIFTLALRSLSIGTSTAAHIPPGGMLAGRISKTAQLRDVTLALVRASRLPLHFMRHPS